MKTQSLLIALMLAANSVASSPVAVSAQAAPLPRAARSDFPAIAAELDTHLQKLAQSGLSAVVLVAKGSDVLLSKGYGYADRTRKIPLTPDMPLHIGSVGKQFTAAATMRLVSDGKLRVEDSLSRFFPDAPANKRGITVHQLLSNTSGLPYLPQVSMLEPRPRASVMKEMLELPLEAAPGAGYRYSSPGYTLLAGVIEAASGQTYEAYVRRMLFEPAGLRTASLAGDSGAWNRAAVRWYTEDTDSVGEPLSFLSPMPGGVGAGSISVSALDLYRWMRVLNEGKVLPEAAVRKLFEPAAVVNASRRYGYGWMLSESPLGPIIHHPGDLGGFNAEVRRYPDQDLVFIVLSNARSGEQRPHRQIVIDTWNALLLARPLPTFTSAVTPTER